MLDTPGHPRHVLGCAAVHGHAAMHAEWAYNVNNATVHACGHGHFYGLFLLKLIKLLLDSIVHVYVCMYKDEECSLTHTVRSSVLYPCSTQLGSLSKLVTCGTCLNRPVTCRTCLNRPVTCRTCLNRPVTCGPCLIYRPLRACLISPVT